MEEEQVILKTHNLTKIFGNLVVLNDVSFELPKNEIVGLLGPNGSGKTTLIKLMNDLITPTSGEILINDKKLDINAKHLISYLPERTYLDMNQKVKDSLKMVNDFFVDFNMDDALHILSLFKIPLDRRLSQLSKGQKGKVQLAIVFGRKVDLYILDEPLDGVDPASRDFIMKIIKRYKKPDSTVLLSTHQISDIEDYLDSAILLKDGQLIEAGSVKSICEKHQMKLGEFFKAVYKYDETSI